MKRRLLFFCLLLLGFVVAISAYVVLHEKKSQRAFPVLKDAATKVKALTEEVDYILVTLPDGKPVVVIRNPNESDKDWFERLDRILAGTESAGQICETLHCTIGTVQICITCMVGESQQDCERRLDAAVDTFCQTHDCEECD